MDYETGQVLYEKEAKAPMYPASTTKMMTALLVLEHLDLDQVITVPEDMGMAEGSAMYLLPGESFTVSQLLDALLVKSANDAAILLAQTVAGDVPSFAALMNNRAREIGALDTHFTNPNGLHDPDHVTTAYDLALIGREAMANPVFRARVGQARLTLDETPQTPEKRYFRNTNHFLWSSQLIDDGSGLAPIYDARVDGIKTGFTTPAGRCLVSSARQGGMRMIAVVLKSQGYEVYADSRKLLNYGLDNFSLLSIFKEGASLGFWEIPQAKEGLLSYGSSASLSYVYNHNLNPDPLLTRTTDLSYTLDEDNPILPGTPIGSMQVTYQDQTWSMPLLAQSSASLKLSFWQGAWAGLTDFFGRSSPGVFVLLALGLLALLALLGRLFLALHLRKKGLGLRRQGRPASRLFKR